MIRQRRGRARLRPLYALCLLLVLGGLTVGCATKSWTQEEIERSSAAAEERMGSLTRDFRRKLAAAREQNKRHYAMVEGLAASTKRLESTLNDLNSKVAKLRDHVDASLAAREKELRAMLQQGDAGVLEEAAQKRTAAVAALREDLTQVEKARRRAAELSQTLQNMLKAYEAAGGEAQK